MTRDSQDSCEKMPMPNVARLFLLRNSRRMRLSCANLQGGGRPYPQTRHRTRRVNPRVGKLLTRSIRFTFLWTSATSKIQQIFVPNFDDMFTYVHHISKKILNPDIFIRVSSLGSIFICFQIPKILRKSRTFWRRVRFELDLS